MTLLHLLSDKLVLKLHTVFNTYTTIMKIQIHRFESWNVKFPILVFSLRQFLAYFCYKSKTNNYLQNS